MFYKRTALLFVLIIVAISLCVVQGRGADAPQDSTRNAASSVAESRMIPYTIIKRDTFLDYKISYDIMVDVVDGRLPTKNELSAISNRLRSSDKKYDRMFVSFYLPGMKINAGSFASAHHKPNPQPVSIYWYILPKEYQKFVPQEDTIRVEAKKPNKEPVDANPLKSQQSISRTWKDVSGKHSTEASLLECKGQVAYLQKSNGKIVGVPLSRLSQADQDFLTNAHQPKVITGKVVGIADGDTLTVLDGSKTQHKIRLTGIDCPETSQAYGKKAKQALFFASRSPDIASHILSSRKGEFLQLAKPSARFRDPHVFIQLGLPKCVTRWAPPSSAE